MLAPGKIIGVFTERAHHLNEKHFNGVGWSMKSIPVHIQGMRPDAKFPATYIQNRTHLDTDVLKEEMLAMTREFLATCPNPGAILFECTNMCPFSSFVAKESDLPVFDVNTLIDTFYRARNPRQYL